MSSTDFSSPSVPPLRIPRAFALRNIVSGSEVIDVAHFNVDELVVIGEHNVSPGRNICMDCFVILNNMSVELLIEGKEEFPDVLHIAEVRLSWCLIVLEGPTAVSVTISMFPNSVTFQLSLLVV